MEPSNTNSKNNKTQLFLKDLEKKEKSFYNRFATKANFFISTNIRLTSFVVVDLLNNILLHGLDTLKVRLQAKSIFNDTSLFQTNQVSKKSKHDIYMCLLYYYITNFLLIAYYLIIF